MSYNEDERKEYLQLREELKNLRNKILVIESKAENIRHRIYQNDFYKKESMYFGSRCNFCLGSTGDGYYNGYCNKCNNYKKIYV